MSFKNKIIFAIMLIVSGLFLYQGFTLLYQGQNEINSSAKSQTINK